MAETFFFVPEGPFSLNELSDEFSNYKDKIQISDIKTLDNANQNDITFFNTLDYKKSAIKTKAAACITKSSLQNYLPKRCLKISNLIMINFLSPKKMSFGDCTVILNPGK